MSQEEMMRQMTETGQGGSGGAEKVEAITVGSAYDTKIEVFGVIYLYNPPDDAILNVPADAPQEPADQTASSNSDAITRRSAG